MYAETNIEKGMGSGGHSHSPSGRPGAIQAVREETGPSKGAGDSSLPAETQLGLQEPAHGRSPPRGLLVFPVLIISSRGSPDFLLMFSSCPLSFSYDWRLLEGKAVSESTVILALTEGRQKCCRFLGPAGQLLLVRHLVAALRAQLGQRYWRPRWWAQGSSTQ